MNIQSLSRDEIRAMLGAARGKRERDFVMILTAWLHGLRASEVVALTAACIDGEFLTVQRKKGSRRTTQPLISDTDPLFDERTSLIEFARNHAANQKLFPISRQHFWYLLQQYGKAAGLPKHKCHPHALKHSIALQTIDEIGIHRVQNWLGHKSIKSTGIYLEVTDEEAAAAVQRAMNKSEKV